MNPPSTASSSISVPNRGMHPSSGPSSMHRRRVQASTLVKGEIIKPWLDKPDRWQRASYWITIGCASLGLIGAGLLCYFDLHSVPDVGNLCLILEDNFDTFDTSIWQHEVEVGGFGNGEFEWTTKDPANSFVEGGFLHIVPTLTQDVVGRDAVFDGYNLTLNDCTSANATRCSVASNSSQGIVLPPVRSARLTTRQSKSVQYGRVEIRAKLPKGDWLWPAFWMLPINDTYGIWPASGEIDIMESRGNGPEYPAQGRNYVTSSLNWGPNFFLNRFFLTRKYAYERHNSYDRDFHTYVLEWNENFMWVFIDTRITRTLDLRFDQSFFDRGRFPKTIINGTDEVVLKNPWEGRNNAAPFDQPFYLILNLAVGGTSGWFPDGQGGKPWLDGSATAMRDFAKAQDQWFPTWPQDPKEAGIVIDYVKMWQKC